MSLHSQNKSTFLDTKSDAPALLLCLLSLYPVSILEREKHCFFQALYPSSTDAFHPEAAPATCRVTDHWVILPDFSACILLEVLLSSEDEIASESII